jgi:uncharacterized protein YndB with AHSA1/START domain
MSKTNVTVNRETNEIIISRDFNAPRQLVWNAYTKAELLEKWWGPRAFTTEVKSIDVRPGGVWHYIMRGTGEALKGTEYEGMVSAGKAYYDEVVEPELLVFKDVFADEQGNDIPNMPIGINTYRFEENNGVTTVTSVTKYETIEEVEKVLAMGMEQGITETLDRLEELLAA